MRTCSICIVPALPQQAGSSRSTSPSWSSSMQFPQISGATVVVLVVDDGVAVVEVEVVTGAVVETAIEVVVVAARLVVVVPVVAGGLVVAVGVVVAAVLVVVDVLVVGTVLVVVALAARTAHNSSPTRPSSALKKRTPPTLAGDSG